MLGRSHANVAQIITRHFQGVSAATLLIGAGVCSVASAATIVVNSTADPGDASTCTLRQAIVSMNTGAVAANSACTNAGGTFGSSNTINFAAGVSTISLTDGLYVGAKDGSGMDLTIDAGPGNNVTVER